MKKNAIVLAALAGLCTNIARADFSYQQNSKITGGMMAGMMKMAGTFSKAAREPMTSTVMVKGDRMANVHTSNTQVIDLGSETITDINFEKKTYSVMTFEEMRKMLEQMQKKMAEKKAENPDAKMNFKVDIKNTGKTQVWNGVDTKQAILTLIMEGTDQKSGQTGNISMVSDMYMAPKIAGYEEVAQFSHADGREAELEPVEQRHGRDDATRRLRRHGTTG